MASQGQGKNERLEQAHDDILGTITTGIVGANQWVVKNIGDTLYPLEYLRNNSNDFFCFHAQSPHWRKQGVDLDSIHIHYILDGAYTSGQTLVFTIYWTWVMPDTILPMLAGWSATTVSVILSATENYSQYHTGIFALVRPVSPPPSEGYGIGLIVRIVRGNGTHTSDLGIWWADAHAVKDRSGSYNEISD